MYVGCHSPKGLPDWVQDNKGGIQNLVSNNSGMLEGSGLAMWRLGSVPATELF